MPGDPYDRFVISQGERWDFYKCPVCKELVRTAAGMPGAFATHLRVHRAKGQVGVIIPRDGTEQSPARNP